MDVIDSDFKVHLDEFTGPLDLLLHLVRSHEMEVRDLPLAQITAEYVEMLQFMKKMDLEVASEFLEIAATLVRFKARALLPSRSLAGDIDDLAAEEEALLEQLVEHQVTRMAAQHLRGREKRAAAVWFRGEKAPPGEVSEDVEIVEADLFSLVGAFKELLAGVDSPRLFAVDRDDYPVAEQVRAVRKRLARGEPIEFRALFEQGAPRGKLIATFLALLELIRAGDARALQESTFGKILIFPTTTLMES
jgi:segregation and condensation protein A